MISRIHKKVSKSEGGNLFGRDIMILHEGCEILQNLYTSLDKCDTHPLTVPEKYKNHYKRAHI